MGLDRCWKKAVFAVLLLAALVRVGYIILTDDGPQNIITIESSDPANAVEIPADEITQTFSLDYDKLCTLDYFVNGIEDEETGILDIQILREDTLLYETKEYLTSENNGLWKQLYVNAPIEAGERYTLKFTPVSGFSEDSTILSNDGDAVVKYGVCGPSDPAEKLVPGVVCVLLLAASYFVLKYFEAAQDFCVRGKNRLGRYLPINAFSVVLELLICIAIIRWSGIPFQRNAIAAFCVGSLLCAYGIDSRSKKVDSIFSSGKKKLLLVFLYAYTAFVLVGQRTLVYPLNMPLSVVKLFIFALGWLWSIPVVKTLMALLLWLGELFPRDPGKRRLNKALLVLLLTAALLLPAAISLIAFNPGISSPDTGAVMACARRLHGMLDWHPAFYCMVIRAIISVWDSTYAVILVQYFFWAYVWIEFFLYLRGKGINDLVLIGLALFLGVNAGNFLYLNTIWKDIPYTLSILWLTVLIGKLTLDLDVYKKKVYIYVELFIALVGIFFYRKNGVVTFLLAVLFLIIVHRKNKRMWTALAAVLLTIGVIKGPVYSYFQIESPGRAGMYIGLSQDILGVYYSGGEVSEETLEMINVMTDYEDSVYKDRYTPTWANQSYALDVDIFDFIKSYIDTFVKNPVMMIRAVVAREDALWDVFDGENTIVGCVNNISTQDGLRTQYPHLIDGHWANMEGPYWNDLYPERVYTPLYDKVLTATNYSVSTQMISAITWRAGIMFWLAVVSFVLLAAGNNVKKYGIIFIPVAGHVLSLLLTTGWSDYRYFWPVNLLAVCIVCFTVAAMGQNRQEAHVPRS